MWQFHRLFSSARHDWIVHSKNGDMIRECRLTGCVEYRDCVEKRWVAVDDPDQVARLKARDWSRGKAISAARPN